MESDNKMMFWQLLPFVCGRELSKDTEFSNRWPWFMEWTNRIEEIVTTQQREVLDTTLPEDLIIEVLTYSKLRFDINDGWLRLTPISSEFPAVEIYHRFGGRALWEAYEYGSFNVSQTP